MKPKIILLVVNVLLCSLLFCQEKKDTIYFDEDWSICEKPVAEYYRVCTLNKDKKIFYKGDVQDYYINGQLEMKSQYANNGYKEGEFIFYSYKGSILKKGNYVNDEMKGNWLYYDSIGNLKAIFNCKSATDFTPIFLINKSDDTLLKNGNGKFVFNTQKDFPFIFQPAEDYTVEGEVADSLKNGEIKYSTPFSQHQNFSSSEIYKKGKFIRSKLQSFVYGSQSAGSPLGLLHLADKKLDKIDRFYHSNLVFGLGTQGDQKVIDYLLFKTTSEIKSNAQNFYDNDRIFFDIIGVVLRKNLQNSANTNVRYDFPSRNPADMYYSFTSSASARNVKGNIILTIDTSGYILNSTFNTNLNQSEINKINYYLFRVSNLVSYQIERQKVLSNINLKLNTLIVSSSENKTNCIYEVYNADSVDENDLVKYASSKAIDSTVQVEAKFPGGQDAWRMYLERNLNIQTPADHGAPAGNYTVTVSFLADKEGNISDVTAINDPGYGTAEEAIRVIKKGPKWIPAIKDGKNVFYRQKQNITFVVVKQ